jgi:hypothetical protein
MPDQSRSPDATHTHLHTCATHTPPMQTPTVRASRRSRVQPGFAPKLLISPQSQTPHAHTHTHTCATRVDPDGACYKALGFSPGFMPDLSISPYAKLLPMLAGIGSPGTLQVRVCARACVCVVCCACVVCVLVLCRAAAAAAATDARCCRCCRRCRCAAI